MSVAAAIFNGSGHTIAADLVCGRCRLCGEDGEGQIFDVWLKPTFTDVDKIGAGEIVCSACLFCTDDHSEVLQRMTGRDKPQRMRNYSHVVRADGNWRAFMKNQKRELADEILSNPRAVVVAYSGQKHLILRARMGWWQLEELTAWPAPDALAALLGPIEALYRAGATKAEIESGNYRQRTLMDMGLDRWRQHEPALARARGMPVFALAVWLAQKEHDDHT